MATKTIKVCDTEGCGNTNNVTSLQEGDFCDKCMAGQHYANACTLAFTSMTEEQEWDARQEDKAEYYYSQY